MQAIRPARRHHLEIAVLIGALLCTRITPAAEWLIDNYHLVEEQVRTARRHLPRGYSRELPRLSNAPFTGTPRVYDIALHAVAHGDGRLGRGTLTRFVASYQTTKLLLLGELWAIPIMLRLALIENLRRWRHAWRRASPSATSRADGRTACSKWLSMTPRA